MTSFDPRLLTPPQQEEEIYPYRRAWRSVVIENGLVLSATLALFVLTNIVGLSVPERLKPIASFGFAVLPAILWLYFSWWQERFVEQPRQRLLVVFIVSGLAATAIGLPLVHAVFQIDRWLPLSSAVSRIVGYTFTVGIVHAILKYVVLRYTVWPDCFRTRYDGVAYGAAVGVGYATALNIQLALTNNLLPEMAALDFLATLTLQVPTGILIAYGLSEMCFASPPVLLPSLTVAFSALLIGLAIPVRAGLTNASLVLGVSSPKELYGLAFSIAFLVVTHLVLSFLYDNAERETQESRIGL